jgi:membrane protease subunit (stomatin/prohibitin family)
MELYSVIKNDGPAGVLFWKFTGEDFRIGSQLIVAENEEALLVRDGIIQEVFEGGRHTLQTNNFPFIDKLLATFSGGKNAFSCKVFFINKAHTMELFWGTDSPIQVRDPRWGIATEIKARGSYSIQVSDSKKFVLKFVSNNSQITTAEEFSNKFRTIFMQKVKSLIPRAIQESNVEILGICSRQDEFAEKLTPELNSAFEEYGVRLVNFYIGALDIPSDDPLRKMVDESAIINNLQGNWDKIQQRDLLKESVQNGNGISGMAAGIGVGMAAGGFMGAAARNFFDNSGNAAQPQQASPATPQSAPAAAAAICSKCSAALPPTCKFCPECGAKQEEKQSFCTNCGNKIPATAKFCPECGTAKM